jgi:formamidopyrimidine-DNA glycosylase
VPELPEVETTRRGVAPLLEGRRLRGLVVREPRLRQPVPADLARRLVGARVERVERRAKYLIFRCAGGGSVLLHLGMSGSLRHCRGEEPLRKHDHLRFLLAQGGELRFHDPRRFGLCLWLEDPVFEHPLLRGLGPEPLAAEFGAESLRAALRGRRAAIKTLLLDGRIVVGVGNIYASEALHRAAIRPTRPGRSLSREECARLVASIRAVLQSALRAGGTTLRDYLQQGGEPGRFAVRLRVYGRAGANCARCGGRIRSKVLGQRSTFWCGDCQH